MMYLSHLAAGALGWPPRVVRVEELLLAADAVISGGRDCRRELDLDEVEALLEEYDRRLFRLSRRPSAPAEEEG